MAEGSFTCLEFQVGQQILYICFIMVEKGDGLTLSEKYLAFLCKRTFLSLWSYSNVFRQPGTELCDLLVVAGNDIIIFSDKFCDFPQSDNLAKDWERWFRKAVAKSARQLWGAEKWIKKYPEQIFLDSKCDIKFPIPIKINDQTKFHLILVAHGASARCKQVHGGTGSLIFNNRIEGLEAHSTPFITGDLDASKTFIHILDDFTLDIVLQTRDTISDFTSYLTKKEMLLRSELNIFIAGEEEMLACYLSDINDNGEHDFVIPDTEATNIVFNEGIWDKFQKNPLRLAQIQADQQSYVWDALIEHFSKHAVNGTMYEVSEGGFIDSEQAIRLLAQETRYSRRVLASALRNAIVNTPADRRRIRVLPRENGVYHAFLLLPFTKEYSNGSYDSYRFCRRQILEATCFVIRLMYPTAKYVVGLAIESGLHPTHHSEDLMCFDCSQWDSEIEERAKKDQKDFKILVSPDFYEVNEKEYPDP